MDMPNTEDTSIDEFATQCSNLADGGDVRERVRGCKIPFFGL